MFSQDDTTYELKLNSSYTVNQLRDYFNRNKNLLYLSDDFETLNELYQKNINDEIIVADILKAFNDSMVSNIVSYGVVSNNSTDIYILKLKK
ncbi:hypothetical protein [Macrococcus carouselicus]|uniref:Uncharacterized protein n=1 Tax=Macrococcus carouselicus TaxID=69969 RepID=A0A9Q8CNP9_9STAP|nr:hypothetical protein [Macrococcus carouselicus]TDM04047.1 hypothetical protein ERX40_02435 [Macrococcus carouselicus]